VNDKWSWEGIQLIWVVFGLVGAALGIASMPKMSNRQLWVALVAGVVCASLGPGLLVELLSWWRERPAVPLPTAVGNGLAFFLGIGGMFIVPGAIRFWQVVQDNPLGFWDWVRGRGPAPVAPKQPPAPVDEDQHKVQP
jgi:hypothetical protein